MTKHPILVNSCETPATRKNPQIFVFSFYRPSTGTLRKNLAVQALNAMVPSCQTYGEEKMLAGKCCVCCSSRVFDFEKKKEKKTGVFSIRFMCSNVLWHDPRWTMQLAPKSSSWNKKLLVQNQFVFHYTDLVFWHHFFDKSVPAKEWRHVSKLLNDFLKAG